jgi:hypothetical protein
LFVYPIKSCAPVELSASDADGRGLSWDRKFDWAEFVKPPRRLDGLEEGWEAVWTFQTLRAKG